MKIYMLIGKIEYLPPRNACNTCTGSGVERILRGILNANVALLAPTSLLINNIYRPTGL